jgi:hypothetical protein
MKEDEMGRACGTSVRRDMHTGYWRENFTSRENLEELGMDDKTKCKRNVQK